MGAPPEPSRSQVADVFAAVLGGSMSRAEASRWAAPWVGAVDSGVGDTAVWKALKLLGGIDLRHGPDEPYLHDDEQIESWRSDLLRAP